MVHVLQVNDIGVFVVGCRLVIVKVKFVVFWHGNELDGVNGFNGSNGVVDSIVLFQWFLETASSLVLFALEVNPLRLHSGIGFQFHIGFHKFVSLADVDGEQVVEEDGVDPFALVFGQDTDKHEVECVGMFPFERFEQVEPAEGQQAAVAALHGM